MRKGPSEKGHRCEEHEKELRFHSYLPIVEKFPEKLPRDEDIGDYRITFEKKVWGGYKVDIIRENGSEVAEGVKVRRWRETGVKDPENGNTIMLKLSLTHPQSIRVTIFKDGKDEEQP